MRSHIPQIIQAEHSSLPNLFLKPKIHLHRARGLKVRSEQALLAAQCLREGRSIGRIRAERRVGGLKLLLQTGNSGSNAAYRMPQICAASRVFVGAPGTITSPCAAHGSFDCALNCPLASRATRS